MFLNSWLQFLFITTTLKKLANQMGYIYTFLQAGKCLLIKPFFNSWLQVFFFIFNATLNKLAIYKLAYIDMCLQAKAGKLYQQVLTTGLIFINCHVQNTG